MKLLTKTIRSYLVYSFVILLVTIPLFYIVVRNVLLHSVDKSLKIQLRDIRSNLPALKSKKDLAIWASLDKDITIAPSGSVFHDSIYTNYAFNKKHNEFDPYRQITAAIIVDNEPYRLTISSSLVENDDLLESIVLVQVVLLILLMGGSLLINRNISKKIWQPFYSTLRHIQQYELNKNTAVSLQHCSTTEFNDLNISVQNLLARNYEIYLQQKEFTENAAHEMQTPLAIFQGKLELLMQSRNLNEEEAALIHSMQNTLQRLARLNKSLLLLAKIENNEYTPVESVDIRMLCSRILESYKYFIDDKRIHLTENGSKFPLIKANPSLIDILISNLMSNAIRHNITDGKLIIEWQQTSVIFKNSGSTQALSAEKIFNRFYKESGVAESTGLGLAIVKRICVMYQFRIEYHFKAELHVFSILFE